MSGAPTENETSGAGLFAGLSEPPAAAGYVVLARKYRPSTFDDLIGQEAMVTTLRNAFAIGRIAQAYMLTGVRGVGKTTTARILARALNYAPADGAGAGPSTDLATPGLHCREIVESRHPDVIEMDAASNTGVDNIREIIENSRYFPVAARYKVFIIDEVHMLSKGAFNALLKTLEEPPPHVKFIFATTEIRRVPVTVLSRCQRFDLRRVDVSVLGRHFARIAKLEGAAAEPEALTLIARAAEGSVRDGLSILDQAIAMGSGAVTEAGVRAMLGLADRGRLFDLLDHLFAGHARDALAVLASLHADGADPVQTLGDLAEGVHIATRIKVAGEAAAGDGLSAQERQRASQLAGKVPLAALSRAWSMLLKGIEETERAPNTQAAADMVLVRIAHAADLPSPEDIIRTLGSGSRRPAGERRGEATAPEARRQGQPQAATETQFANTPTALAGQSAPLDPSASAEEPPPPASLDDYGADNAEPPEDEGEGDDIGAFPVTRPVLDDPRSFEEVVAVAARHRDARLRVHLEEHVSLVKFDAGGSIEVALLPGAPPELANDLREKLNKWTGRRWIIAVRTRPGDPPLGEVRRARDAAELEALKSHPGLAELLETFPDARIVSVKPVTISGDDEDAASA
jgi:DNA polymerase-3 subunit gamma/tau